MKIKTIGELHGYFLTEKQFKEIQEIEGEEGKKMYYLPSKWKRGKSMDKPLLEKLVMETECKQDIIKELDCTLTQLNNFLNRNYGCMAIDRVRKVINPNL